MTLTKAFILLGLCLAGLTHAEDRRAQNTQRAHAAIAAFQQGLQAQLKAAIQSGGPAAAIAVCQQAAPDIAASVGAAHGLRVKRISARPRNADAAPTPQDQRALEQFTQALRAGKAPPLETWIQLDEQAPQFYRAITIQPLCLTCHGDKLDPAVADKLHTLYPEDSALGYQLGELRGAFVVSF